MPKEKGWKGPNSRDMSVVVRLTGREKNAVIRNAKTASLEVSDFVRARILPPVKPTEKLEAPKPGGVLRAKRSALTKAIQSILLNLKQLEPYIEGVENDDVYDGFYRLQKDLRSLQKDHLESGARAVHLRADTVDLFNDFGKSLNRETATAHGAGEVKKPSRLLGVLSDLQGVADAARIAPEETTE